jgi:hypothetical protein
VIFLWRRAVSRFAVDGVVIFVEHRYGCEVESAYDIQAFTRGAGGNGDGFSFADPSIDQTDFVLVMNLIAKYTPVTR